MDHEKDTCLHEKSRSKKAERGPVWPRLGLCVSCEGLHTSLIDREGAASIDLGVSDESYWLGKSAHLECVNNTDRLYLFLNTLKIEACSEWFRCILHLLRQDIPSTVCLPNRGDRRDSAQVSREVAVGQVLLPTVIQGFELLCLLVLPRIPCPHPRYPVS